MNCLCLKVVQMVYGNIDGYNSTFNIEHSAQLKIPN